MPIAVNRRGIAFLEFSQIPESELDPAIYRPLRFTFIAIRHPRGFLLVYHRARQTWELPGGHIEDGESSRDCAVREFFEETGQKVEPLAFKAVLRLRDTANNRLFFSALYSGQVTSLVPFYENEEISRITLWDGKTDIGYVDEIDAAVINLLQTGGV